MADNWRGRHRGQGHFTHRGDWRKRNFNTHQDDRRGNEQDWGDPEAVENWHSEPERRGISPYRGEDIPDAGFREREYNAVYYEDELPQEEEDILRGEDVRFRDEQEVHFIRDHERLSQERDIRDREQVLSYSSPRRNEVDDWNRSRVDGNEEFVDERQGERTRWNMEDERDDFGDDRVEVRRQEDDWEERGSFEQNQHEKRRRFHEPDFHNQRNIYDRSWSQDGREGHYSDIDRDFDDRERDERRDFKYDNRGSNDFEDDRRDFDHYGDSEAAGLQYEAVSPEHNSLPDVDRLSGDQRSQNWRGRNFDRGSRRRDRSNYMPKGRELSQSRTPSPIRPGDLVPVMEDNIPQLHDGQIIIGPEGQLPPGVPIMIDPSIGPQIIPQGAIVGDNVGQVLVPLNDARIENIDCQSEQRIDESRRFRGRGRGRDFNKRQGRGRGRGRGFNKFNRRGGHRNNEPNMNGVVQVGMPEMMGQRVGPGIPVVSMGGQMPVLVDPGNLVQQVFVPVQGMDPNVPTGPVSVIQERQPEGDQRGRSWGRDSNNRGRDQRDRSLKHDSNNRAGDQRGRSWDRDSNNRDREQRGRSWDHDSNNRDREQRGRSWDRDSNNRDREQRGRSWGRDSNNRGRDQRDRSLKHDSNNRSGDQRGRSWDHDSNNRDREQRGRSLGRDSNNRDREKRGRSWDRDSNNRGRDQRGISLGHDSNNRGRDQRDRSWDHDSNNRDREQSGRSWGRDSNNRGRDQRGISLGHDSNNKGRDHRDKSWDRDSNNRSRDQRGRSWGRDSNNRRGDQRDRSWDHESKNLREDQSGRSWGHDPDNMREDQRGRSWGHDPDNMREDQRGRSWGRDPDNTKGDQRDRSWDHDSDNWSERRHGDNRQRDRGSSRPADDRHFGRNHNTDRNRQSRQREGRQRGDDNNYRRHEDNKRQDGDGKWKDDTHDDKRRDSDMYRRNRQRDDRSQDGDRQRDTGHRDWVRPSPKRGGRQSDSSQDRHQRSYSSKEKRSEDFSEQLKDVISKQKKSSARGDEAMISLLQSALTVMQDKVRKDDSGKKHSSSFKTFSGSSNKSKENSQNKAGSKREHGSSVDKHISKKARVEHKKDSAKKESDTKKSGDKQTSKQSSSSRASSSGTQESKPTAASSKESSDVNQKGMEDVGKLQADQSTIKNLSEKLESVLAKQKKEGEKIDDKMVMLLKSALDVAKKRTGDKNQKTENKKEVPVAKQQAKPVKFSVKPQDKESELQKSTVQESWQIEIDDIESDEDYTGDEEERTMEESLKERTSQLLQGKRTEPPPVKLDIKQIETLKEDGKGETTIVKRSKLHSKDHLRKKGQVTEDDDIENEQAVKVSMKDKKKMVKEKRTEKDTNQTANQSQVQGGIVQQGSRVQQPLHQPRQVVPVHQPPPQQPWGSGAVGQPQLPPAQVVHQMPTISQAPRPPTSFSQLPPSVPQPSMTVPPVSSFPPPSIPIQQTVIPNQQPVQHQSYVPAPQQVVQQRPQIVTAHPLVPRPPPAVVQQRPQMVTAHPLMPRPPPAVVNPAMASQSTPQMMQQLATVATQMLPQLATVAAAATLPTRPPVVQRPPSQPIIQPPQLVPQPPVMMQPVAPHPTQMPQHTVAYTKTTQPTVNRYSTTTQLVAGYPSTTQPIVSYPSTTQPTVSYPSQPANRYSTTTPGVATQPVGGYPSTTQPARDFLAAKTPVVAIPSTTSLPKGPIKEGVSEDLLLIQQRALEVLRKEKLEVEEKRRQLQASTLSIVSKGDSLNSYQPQRSVTPASNAPYRNLPRPLFLSGQPVNNYQQSNVVSRPPGLSGQSESSFPDYSANRAPIKYDEKHKSEPKKTEQEKKLYTAAELLEKITTAKAEAQAKEKAQTTMTKLLQNHTASKTVVRTTSNKNTSQSNSITTTASAKTSTSTSSTLIKGTSFSSNDKSKRNTPKALWKPKPSQAKVRDVQPKTSDDSIAMSEMKKKAAEIIKQIPTLDQSRKQENLKACRQESYLSRFQPNPKGNHFQQNTSSSAPTNLYNAPPPFFSTPPGLQNMPKPGEPRFDFPGSLRSRMPGFGMPNNNPGMVGVCPYPISQSNLSTPVFPAGVPPPVPFPSQQGTNNTQAPQISSVSLVPYKSSPPRDSSGKHQDNSQNKKSDSAKDRDSSKKRSPSSRRSKSPKRRHGSLKRRSWSPNQKRNSPLRRSRSPIQRHDAARSRSPNRRREGSLGRRSRSRERRRDNSPYRYGSPGRRSPDLYYHRGSSLDRFPGPWPVHDYPRPYPYRDFSPSRDMYLPDPYRRYGSPPPRMYYPDIRPDLSPLSKYRYMSPPRMAPDPYGRMDYRPRNRSLSPYRGRSSSPRRSYSPRRKSPDFYRRRDLSPRRDFSPSRRHGSLSPHSYSVKESSPASSSYRRRRSISPGDPYRRQRSPEYEKRNDPSPYSTSRNLSPPSDSNKHINVSPRSLSHRHSYEYKTGSGSPPSDDHKHSPSSLFPKEPQKSKTSPVRLSDQYRRSLSPIYRKATAAKMLSESSATALSQTEKDLTTAVLYRKGETPVTSLAQDQVQSQSSNLPGVLVDLIKNVEATRNIGYKPMSKSMADLLCNVQAPKEQKPPNAYPKGILKKTTPAETETTHNSKYGALSSIQEAYKEPTGVLPSNLFEKLSALLPGFRQPNQQSNYPGQSKGQEQNQNVIQGQGQLQSPAGLQTQMFGQNQYMAESRNINLGSVPEKQKSTGMEESYDSFLDVIGFERKTNVQETYTDGSSSGPSIPGLDLFGDGNKNPGFTPEQPQHSYIDSYTTRQMPGSTGSMMPSTTGSTSSFYNPPAVSYNRPAVFPSAARLQQILRK